MGGRETQEAIPQRHPIAPRVLVSETRLAPPRRACHAGVRMSPTALRVGTDRTGARTVGRPVDPGLR